MTEQQIQKLKEKLKIQLHDIRELKQHIILLNKEIGKRDCIINYQSQTNNLLLHHIEEVTKTEQKIKNISLKVKNLLNQEIILQ